MQTVKQQDKAGAAVITYSLLSLAIWAGAIAAVMAVSAPAQASTPLQRCVEISDYAEGVANLRDEGVRLVDVKEFNAERAMPSMVDAYDLAATLTYRHSDLTPAQVRTQMLKGCVQAVNDENARRAN